MQHDFISKNFFLLQLSRSKKSHLVSPLLFFFARNLILVRKEQEDKRAAKKIALCFLAPFFLCDKFDFTSQRTER